MPTKDSVTGFTILGPVNEESTPVYSSVVYDANGELVQVMTSVKMTITDIDSKVVINNRDKVELINNQVFEYTEGTLSVKFTTDDLVVVDQRKQYEDHYVRFDYAFSGGEGHHIFIMRVRNLSKIGTGL